MTAHLQKCCTISQKCFKAKKVYRSYILSHIAPSEPTIRHQCIIMHTKYTSKELGTLDAHVLAESCVLECIKSHWILGRQNNNLIGPNYKITSPPLIPPHCLPLGAVSSLKCNLLRWGPRQTGPSQSSCLPLQDNLNWIPGSTLHHQSLNWPIEQGIISSVFHKVHYSTDVAISPPHRNDCHPPIPILPQLTPSTWCMWLSAMTQQARLKNKMYAPRLWEFQFICHWFNASCDKNGATNCFLSLNDGSYI